jgi:lipoprotein-anchoring transpeptidase ErfK/SrfK
MKALRPGTSGKNVVCLQEALVKNNYLKTVTGTYDVTTQVAVTALQTEKDLFVDGIAGRETALALGIWPDENLLVVRTPPPAEGAKDSLGFLLSSVASTGASAPALPANSGSGRRLVFERAGQRVWAVSKNDEVIRSWLVSGSKYNNETVGTHQVYSRSEITTAWNGKAFLKKMVRWLKTEIGAIGFHQIPLRRSDNTVYQTEAELGTRLSGGCQRQAKLDADFLWSFAKIGTPVVVL